MKKTTKKPIQIQVPLTQAIANDQKNKSNFYWLLALIVVTTICFWGVLNCGFVNFDDELYIMNNQLLHSLSLSNIYDWFFTEKAIYGGNYHPLVTLTNAIEYSISGLNPTTYHVTNLAIHLINTLLVFMLVMKISRQNQIISFAVAILFGIHPMHVESVVWISERKDVLYAAFYLSAIIQYINYVEKNKKVKYVLSIMFFLLSLLSKSMAVTLPLVLLAIDYYMKGNIKRTNIINKLPYFLLSLTFGFLAIYSQKLQGYIADYGYSTIDKLFLTSYSWVYYLLHLFAPINLSVLHPFLRGGLPAIYYLSVLVVILIVVIAIKYRELRKTIIFGLLFYTLSISVVLQFVTVGAGVAAERYTYIPYIGLFYIIAVLLEPFYQIQKTLVSSLFVITVLIFGYITIDRLSAWKDGETLWRDATAKNPETADYAWYGLGNILKEKNGNRAEVINAYNKAISINTAFPNYFYNRSIAKFGYGDTTGALSDLNNALLIKPAYPEAFYSRGIILEEQSKHTEAVNEYSKAINLRPEYLEAIFNRAIAFKNGQQYDAAIADYKKVLSLNPEYINAYTNLGNIYYLNKNYNEAIRNYSKSLSIDSKQANVFMNRAVAYIGLDKKYEACADIKTAVELGDPNAKQAQQALCK